MNATMAVLAREVSARRELLLMAVAVAIMISLLPFLPIIETHEATDVRTVGSGVSALALGWVLALLLGATVFGNDLSAGRLGFFFARPVSGLAVWWGRVLAVMTLVWSVEIIVLAPALLSEGTDVFTSSEGVDWLTILGYVAAPILLFLLAHAVSVMARARTPWLILDMAGAFIVGIIGWLNLRPLFEIGAPTALFVVAGALIAAVMLALSVGGAIGVVVGRVDLHRTHGALSLALWGTLAICVAGIATYSGWLRDFGPPEFDDIDVLSVSPDGRWAEVLGGAPRHLDVRRRYLLSTVDKRWVSLPAHAVAYGREVVYSRDGSTAVWVGAGLKNDPRTLWWSDLARRDPSARSSTLVVSPEAVFVLSPDGARVAILEEGTVSTYELGDERLLTAVRLPEELQRGSMLFDSRDALRIFARSGDGDGQSLLIAEVDTTSGNTTLTGEIEDLPKEPWFAVDSGLNRLVTWTRSQDLRTRIYAVFDAKSGAPVSGLSGAGFRHFLTDGRLAFLQGGGDGPTRLVVETIGSDDRVVLETGRGEYWRLSGEVLPGIVAVSRLEDPSDGTLGRHIDLVDVDSGEMRGLGGNMRRALTWFRWLQGHTRGIFWYGNQPSASRLFIDRSGALVRWDPESEELVHVVGGRR